MIPERVVICSVGAVTSEGVGAAALWDGVVNARVAIRPMRQIPMQGFGTSVGGEVGVAARPNHDYLRPKGHRDPAIDFAIKAAEEAMDGAASLHERLAPERWGIVVGTCNAGLLSGEEWYASGMAWGSDQPQMLLLVPPQALAEALAGCFALRGPALSIATACAAGANAVGAAAQLIRGGQADAVLAGGSDALSAVVFAGFTSMEALSPASAAPYSRSRQGLSLGEGSGMLVLVRQAVAEQLGLPVIAELVSLGLSADGYHPTAPHPQGEGAARAITAALKAGGVRPDQVAYINGHGTGTPKNDPAETSAIKAAFGPASAHVMVSSTKSMIGHLLGAAGAVEAIVTARALEEQVAPPTANFDEGDPECDLDYVPNRARPAKIDYALSNNFAFGGANAVLLLARAGVVDGRLPAVETDQVVVTGLGAVSPAGVGIEALLEAYRGGRECLAVEDGARVGRTTFDPNPFLTTRDRRRMDRLSVFAVSAAKLALADAALTIDESNRARVGVLFATGLGPMEVMEEFVRPLLAEGPAAANPALFPNVVYNAAGGYVAMFTGAVGPASTLTTGFAAGASALAYGYELTSANEADAILCVAADTLNDTVIRAHRELGMLGDGSGFGLSEMGVAVLLERRTAAQRRGARIYGSLASYGFTSDGLGIATFDIQGRGLERAMAGAVYRAGVWPDSVGRVWTSAAGFRPADHAENVAIRRYFGDIRREAPKMLLGEPMGAGGALNLALALKSREPDDQAPAVVNSCSLGGTHVSLVVR
jgi:3-oxoacyl-[acyl-carrier-protein] synthase II